jgi:hypothetical protein
MSNGRPTMRNYLDQMQEQTLVRVTSLSNSDILSKSLDEWIAQLVQEFASPEIPVLDLTKISRTGEQGEVPAYDVPNPKFSHVPRVQGLIHYIHVPFTGNRDFFHYHPAGWVDEFPGAAVDADELILAIGGAQTLPPIHEVNVLHGTSYSGRASINFVYIFIASSGVRASRMFISCSTEMFCVDSIVCLRWNFACRSSSCHLRTATRFSASDNSQSAGPR